VRRGVHTSGRLLYLALGLVAGALFLPASASAATLTWDGEVDNKWSTPGNWVGNVAPANGDSVVLNTNGHNPTNNDLGSGIEFDVVTLEDGSDPSEPLSISSGNPIRLSFGLSNLIDSNRTASTTLGTGIDWDDGGGTVSQRGAGSFTVGNISGDPSSSSFLSLTGSGTGPIVLSGSNNLQDVVIADVAVEFAIPSALGTGNVELQANGSLRPTSPMTLTKNVTLGNQGGGIDTAGNDVTVSGVVSGIGDLVKTGTGQLTLTGANTYTGGTTVSAGSLAGNTTSLQGAIANNAALVFNQTANGTYSGVISGTGVLTKTGTGTLTLAAANSYSGGTEIDGGVLSVSTYSLLGTGGITIRNAATLRNTGIGTENLDAPVQLGTGGGVLDISSAEIFSNGQVSGAGSLTKAGAGILWLGNSGNSYSGGTVVSAGDLNGSASTIEGDVTNNARLRFVQGADGTFGGAISGTGQVLKTQNGTLTLTGANTYSGGTTVSAGTLRGDAQSLQGNIANSATVEFNQASAGTYGGVISGSGQVRKTGSGPLTLAGTSTYFGSSNVNAGTLAVTGSIANSDVNVNNGGTLAGTGTTSSVDVNAGGTVSPGTSIGTLTTDGDMTFRSAEADFEVELGNGGSADRLEVTGGTDLDGARLGVTLVPGYNHVGGTTFAIVDSTSSIDDTFAGLPDGSTFDVDGHRFRIEYATNAVELVAVRVAPTISGTASGPVQVGGQLSDTATLASGLGPTGQITFRLYGPGDTNCSGTPVFTDTKNVSGNGSYSSANFSPSAPGTYRWTAAYSGDEDNEPKATSCGDASQAVTVSAAPTPDPDPDPTPDPDPSHDAPDPVLEVVGLERDHEAGTATLTIAANRLGSVHVEKTNKVKGFGPVDITQAGEVEVEIAPRNKAAEKLRRTGRVTVNPLIKQSLAGGGEIGIRHQFQLRLDNG
jgi:autotransporter-associated beta strand protein